MEKAGGKCWSFKPPHFLINVQAKSTEQGTPTVNSSMQVTSIQQETQLLGTQPTNRNELEKRGKNKTVPHFLGTGSGA